MEHVAIDLGATQSQICIRDSDGKILEERRIRTADLAEFLARRSSSRVVVETGAESFFVADAGIRLGHDVRVVPATLAPSLGVGARRTKRDRNDARNLSEASCRMELPSVHVPSQLSRDRKTMCGMRDALTAARTMLINCVRGWLRTQVKTVRQGVAGTFPRRVRDSLSEPPSPYIERLLDEIESLNASIKQADQELAAAAKADTTCTRLMTVPGVGPLTAIRFAAAIDDYSRFPSAHHVESYIGLVPGEWSSGQRERRLAITKAGPRALRWTLVQAAWSARHHYKADPMVRWSLQLEQRRGKCIAVIALARKIAGALYAIWRDNTVYAPQRTAQATT
jgi:transposase